MNSKTISQLEAEGFTHLNCRCLNPRCRHCVGVPFAMIRREHPRLLLNAMTFDELTAKMICGKCGNRDVEFKPDAQHLAQGFARNF